ncbi:MAG: hypothetical protein OHK0026_03150 [Rhodocyclaceae bacterium]
MVIIMDSSDGKRLDEFGAYEDEVMSSGWLPHPGLGLQAAGGARGARREPPEADAEEFLRRVYLSQE